MRKRTISFLRRSFVTFIIICIIVFMAMAMFLTKRVQSTITQISEFYMSETNKQLQQKFSLVIELLMEKMDGVMNRVPSDTAVYGDEMIAELRASALVRNFIYLGLLDSNGELETIYGNDMKIIDNENIMEALDKNETIAETGEDSEGNKSLLLGRIAQYPMENGEKSKALICGISAEYLTRRLFLDPNNAEVYTHIIDSDGTYVIRKSIPGSASSNYLDYVRYEMEGIDPEVANQYVNGLATAIRERKNYATTIIVSGEPRYVYCVPLHENSTWYLVSVMPAGFLNDSISQLDQERILLIGGSFLIILLVMSVIFFKYYHLSRQHMYALDAAKKEAELASQSKSDFLSSMSHDIRTPMNAIMGMSEIALTNIDDTARVRDCLVKLRLSGKHLLGLINDILDLSKIESGKMTLHINQLSLREIMDDIVNIVQPQIKEKKQHFDIFIQDISCENIWCDGVRLNQVLLNLLSNALKFTPNGGKIEVRLSQEPSELGEEYVRTHFQVDDTGIGMSPEFLERIFDKFERENSDRVHQTTGSGLGMAITKRILDMMNGSINIKSEEGVGSSFHITLDFKKAKSDEEMNLPAWNILVVDDSELLCMSAASNLQSMGVHAEWTQNGMKAADMVQDRHSRHEDYQFVLVDWKMPSPSGLQTIQEIHRRVGTDTPIFLISAYDFTDIQNELESVQIEGFIPKPLFKSTLYAYLSQYMEESAPQASQPEEKTTQLEGKHILVAEDNDVNWEIVDGILGNFGPNLERAENGAVCVEKFQQSAPGYYDIILMDIQMPEMNGYEATKAIRAMDRPDSSIPIIAMTADAFSEDVQHCMECGMNYHLAKPLDFGECINVLQRFLNEAAQP